MKIYRIAQLDEKKIEWRCPNTNIYIIAYMVDGSIQNGYELYCSDNSFVDNFDNFFHARNWAKKHLDRDCSIPSSGKRTANCSSKILKTAQDRLQEILQTMDVPIRRVNDYSWLARNLAIRNSKHPDFVEAKQLIRDKLHGVK